MRLDPATGRTLKVATISTQFGMAQADLVYNGASYILMGHDGATSSSLYRVPL